MITLLQRHETVHVLVNDAGTAVQVRERLLPDVGEAAHVVYHVMPTADAWLRDSGPIFLTPTQAMTAPLVACDWNFNAWGNKYTDLLIDDALPQHIAAWLDVPRVQPGIVLEGGSIDVNGRGSCLTTEQCLLNANRNPHLSRDEIAAYLHNYLGAQQTIWLGQGLVGDDTDGHVDDLARFVDAHTIVCMLSDDPQDVNYAALQDNYRRLCMATDVQGQPFRLVPLPMPGTVATPDGPLPASYANFYIANGVVLVPTYAHPHDAVVLTTLQELFPTRQVHGVPCTALVWGMGAIHCVTQQQPAV
jgi:agmatine deiminase